MDDMKQLYNEILMSHYIESSSKRELAEKTHSQLGINPSCGDELTIEINFKDNIIKDIAYNGQGCAISQSSSSIMSDLVRNKAKEEALEIISIFYKLLQQETLTEEEKETLDEAIVFETTAKMPSRIKCAKLSWITLEKMLNEIN